MTGTQFSLSKEFHGGKDKYMPLSFSPNQNSHLTNLLTHSSIQAAGMITVTEHITHTIAPTQDTHTIHIEQRMTGGFKGGEEDILIPGPVRASVHNIFGAITEQASWTDLSDSDDEWLKSGWLDEEGENGQRHLKAVAKSEIVGWELEVVWGFVLVEGERRHSRRMVCRKEGVTERTRIIYGWVGPK